MPPDSMAAAVLTGHGGPEMIQYRTDWPVPRPGRHEVLIEVRAAAINNTDINTRTGWYSKAVQSATDELARGKLDDVEAGDASWSGVPLTFPRIQGADVCGRIVEVGEAVAPERVGERVLVRTMLRTPVGHRPFECWTFGSECDGGFAQFTVAPADDTFEVRSGLSDEVLAAVPCAYSTAENVLHRTQTGAEHVLVTGASGGVGLAAVQLAKRRGATVTAMCSPGKSAYVLAEGADQTVGRDADLVDELGESAVDVVLDLVGGPGCQRLLNLLRPGGRYAVAGAIGGPLAEIDLRTVYLKDLSLFGCTCQDDAVFANLIGYLERDELRPVVSRTYPLADIVRAQQDFLDKAHVGKLVLIPPVHE